MKNVISLIILMSYMGNLSPMFAESLVDLCEKHGRTKVVCENATSYQEDSNFVAQECDVAQDEQGDKNTLVAQDARNTQPYDVNRTARTTEDSSKVQDAQGTENTLVAQDAHTFPKIASVLIDCTKGGVVSLDDAKIEIPPYALSENTQISIEKINQIKYTGELQNVTKDFAGYRFLPAGTLFQKEVVITLPYENEVNNHKYLKDNLKTFFYDTKIEKWIELKRIAIDEDLAVVKSITTHFTDMINGTLSMPETPGPLDHNINSIKNLEAANPDEGFVSLEGFKAGPQGDASFVIPVPVIGGRRGLVPNVSIMYSSENPNGLMGQGFDISYGEVISTDTRFGLPKYNTKDTYVLNGVELYEKERYQNGQNVIISYAPRKEQSFERIRRFVTSSDDYWVVTSKNGVSKYFGTEEASWNGKSNAQRFSWYLTKVEDLYGNCVTYTYSKTQNYVYPELIRWTNTKKLNDGNYTLRFEYDESRPDVVTEARSKALSVQQKRITKLITEYKGSPIRKIKIDYTNDVMSNQKSFVNKISLKTCGISQTSDDVGQISDAGQSASSTSDDVEQTYCQADAFQDEIYDQVYEFEYEQIQKNDLGQEIYFAEKEKWGNGNAVSVISEVSSSADISTSAGVGFGKENFDARLTGGFQGSVNNSMAWSDCLLCDINGDGRPDRVEKFKDEIKVYTNTGSGFTNDYYTVPCGENELNSQQSYGVNIGGNMYGGVGFSGLASANLGFSYSVTNQTNSMYLQKTFLDVDGDRLCDIVESGLTTYLHNNGEGADGKVTFSEYAFTGNKPIQDVSVNLTQEEKDKYSKTFYVQTPFRVWRSPYEGTVEVEQSFKSAFANVRQDDNNQLKRFTFFENDLISNDKVSQSVKPTNEFYFIHDTGLDTRDKDCLWNIKIKYTKLKALKKESSIRFCPTEILTASKEVYVQFASDYPSIDINQELVPLYNTERYSEEVADNDNVKNCITKMTLKKDWQNYLSENVCNVLLANTQYLPETISEKDFDLCIEHCKNTEVDLPKSSGKIRTLLESYEKECSQKKFYLKEGVHNSKLLECIPYSIIFAAKEKLYEKENIVPIFENCKVKYRSTEYIQEQETRKLDSLGCVINENEFISLGVINNQIVLIQELPDGKYCLKKNDSLFSKDVNENTSVDVNINTANKSVSINLKNEECVINFTLSDFVVSGEELSKEEFERIKNTFKTDKTNIYSDVWNRSFSEEGLESLFDTFIKEDGEKYFSDTQKKEIIELRYEYKEKEYLPKTNVDLAVVNKYLSDYEDYYFEKIAFPYYEKSNEGDFYIVKENVVFNADYQKRLESLNIGYYSRCSYYILYNEEYEYPIFYEAIDDLESSSAQKAYIEMLCGSDKGIIRQRINILENEEFPKLVFNSGEDFSKENLVKQKIIDDNLKTSVKEKLYGGVNNWYYGVWIGLQNENEFSKSKLYKDYDKEYNESDFNNEAYEEKVKSESENKNTIENQSVNFCLPSVIELYPEALSSCVSTVSKTEMSYSSETKIPVQKSYQFASYINKDYIHVSRLGGTSYYDIDGLDLQNNEQSNAFKIPTIQSNLSESIDRTWGVNAAFESPIDAGLATELASLINLEASGSGSLTHSKNESETKITQSLKDFNSDGLVDIVQKKNGGIEVLFSKKIGNEIKFSDEVASYAISEINKNSAIISTTGASFSSSGSVSIVPSIDGIVTNVRIYSSGSSKGTTVCYGESKNTQGLVDINADGLEDYYDGNILLNCGDSFVSYSNGYSVLNLLERNETYTKSGNVGLSSSGGGSQAQTLTNSIGVNGGLSFSANKNNALQILLDIDGDGLLDVVKKNDAPATIERPNSKFLVRYNTGNSFTEEKEIYIPDWNCTSQEAFSFSTKTDGNIGATYVSSTPIIGPLLKDSNVFEDMTKSGVAFNPYGGSSLESNLNNLTFSSAISFGINGTVSANGNASIPIWGGNLNITINVSAGSSSSARLSGVAVSLIDMDGDGLEDHVLRIPDEGLWVKRNVSGKCGLLKTVKSSSGLCYDVDYELTYGSSRNPFCRYVMKTVTISEEKKLPETFTGVRTYTTNFVYENPYYSRNERMFFGFEKVKTLYADGSYLIEVFCNDEYYKKMCVIQKEFYSQNGKLLKSTETQYMNSPLCMPCAIGEVHYEEDSENFMSLKTEFVYDSYGSVIECHEYKNDEYFRSGYLDYENKETDSVYLVGLPKEIIVKDKGGNVLRKREGSYNITGDLIKIKQYWDNKESTYLENTFFYDEIGNLSKTINGSGVFCDYEYDKENALYITKIVNGSSKADYCYTSTATYEPQFGLTLSETDINSNTIKYVYDDKARLKEVWTPYDTDGMPSVSYEYYTFDNLHDSDIPQFWYAITNNKVMFNEGDSSISNGDNIMQTVVVIDSFGRSLLTAKSGEKYNEDSTTSVGWNVSGKVEYDGKARVVKQYVNSFVPGSLENLLDSVNETPSNDLFMELEYDDLNRVVKQTYPFKDGEGKIVIQNNFSIVTKEATPLFKTTVIDPMNNFTNTYTDANENIVLIEKISSENKLLTKSSYEYDEIGSMINAFDAKQNPIEIKYDLLGRRISIYSKDSGLNEYHFNADGNIDYETSAVLKAKGLQTNYFYDEFLRLIKIDYPISEDTEYEYGKSDAVKNQIGKIISVKDESGKTEYEYGSLGEIVKEIRSINRTGGKEPVLAVTQYRSDYLGRIQNIIYPDGENVIYSYDKGGNVKSVLGIKAGYDDFEYVKDCGYDEYSRRVYIKYGNGVQTKYEYDESRGLLKKMFTNSRTYDKIQNMSYKFDLTGNVLSYINDSKSFKTEQNYSYDDLYQLTGVNGKTKNNFATATNPLYEANYSQQFVFSDDGLCNMMQKNSQQNVVFEDDLNYELDFEYDADYSHRLKRAGKRYYRYDESGNLIREQDAIFSEDETTGFVINQINDDLYVANSAWANDTATTISSGLGKSDNKYYYRDFEWNERNLLKRTTDAQFVTDYIYNFTGDRVVKRSERSETLYFNKFFTQKYDEAYMRDGGRISKNIYLGSDRLVTKTAPVALYETFETTDTAVEKKQIYYYHSNHVGSVEVVTDYNGELYEHLEYTPYGEVWINENAEDTYFSSPFKFSAKERDEETGLYYYGARYLDAKYSRWISTDPAIGEYIPHAPIDDEAKKHNQNLPGMGGIFNLVNSNFYHYAGNNPVKYIDPDGRKIRDADKIYMQSVSKYQILGDRKYSDLRIIDYGCVLTAYVRIARALGYEGRLEDANLIAIKEGLYTDYNLLTIENGVKLVNILIKDTTKYIEYTESISGTNTELGKAIKKKENSTETYFATIRVSTSNLNGDWKFDHTMNINSNSVIASNDITDIDNCFDIKYSDTSMANRAGTHDKSRKNIPIRIDFFIVRTKNWAMLENKE